jgi:hypothetical protein
MSRDEHYREAERLVYEASRPSGLPADVAPPMLAEHHTAMVLEALVHATLAAVPHPPPSPKAPWWRRIGRTT